MSNNLRHIIILNLLFCLYSISGIFTKLAADEGRISIKFISYYIGVLGIMGVYAIVWQQLIKKLPLTVAYANKAVCLIWGLLWGVLLFKEKVTVGKISAIIMVMTGIVIYSQADSEQGKNV